MKGVRAEQPKHFRWMVIGVPSVLIIIVIALEVRAYFSLGFSADNLLLWAILVGIFAILLLPLRRLPRAVNADIDGLTVHYYVGGRRWLKWDDIKLVELREPGPALHSAQCLIQVKPRDGRPIVFTDLMTNFDQLSSVILEHKPLAS